MIGLCRQLSVSSIQKVLQLLTGQKIFALLFLGCLAVTPMIVYDKVYADKLSVPSRGGFFNMTSWSLNVVNNVAGAGGMVGLLSDMRFWGNMSMLVLQLKCHFTSHFFRYQAFRLITAYPHY